MRVMFMLLLLATVAASGGRTAQTSAAHVPYLVGYGPCVAIEEGWRVANGTRLRVLAANKKLAEVTVEELHPWTGRSFGGPRRPPTDCTAWFAEELTSASDGDAVTLVSLARVSVPVEDGDAFFALAPQQARIIIAGAPGIVGPAERRRLADAVRGSLPGSWTTAQTLVHAQRYGAGGHQVIELSVGRPTRNARGVAPPIRHVAIRRFFFVDGRMVASEDYERTSEVEERVDLEGPQLTNTNWFLRETENTIAYVSSSEGTSWERLRTSVGFESIVWEVQKLEEGLPVILRRDLYTHH